MNFPTSGAIAGAISAIAFVVLHQIIISDIWFSAILLVIAGAACGSSLGWTYETLIINPTHRSWTLFNIVWVLMYVFLAVVSEIVFEPITTVAVLIDNNEPPGELIGRAMPVTIGFTLVAALVIGWIFNANWSKIGPILLTSTLLVLTLGLNVSIIGLVAFPNDSLYLLAEMFGLIFALGAVFAIAVVVLERKQFRAGSQ